MDDRLKSFWELESFGISPSSSSDSLVYEEFENSIHFVDGRYQVELPWKESHPPLADHYDLCLKCLHGLVRQLQQDPVVLQEYDMTIKGQLQRQIVEPIQETPDSICRVHYLSHHAAVRHDKETTKVCVVYDASARTGGPSLNNCLHAGPKFNQRIMDILMRFRVRRVEVIADNYRKGLPHYFCSNGGP